MLFCFLLLIVWSPWLCLIVPERLAKGTVAIMTTKDIRAKLLSSKCEEAERLDLQIPVIK